MDLTSAQCVYLFYLFFLRIISVSLHKGIYVSTNSWFTCKLHECVGSALRALGPETFLSILPLNLDSEDLSEANLWLFPILKQYTIGARLSFFTGSILSMIEVMKQKSALV